MSPSPRYLTKSRFQLALECPTKLYYTGKDDYVNTSDDDSFLASLAEGGHQVGALAQTMYPGGVLVNDAGHVAQLIHTQELLQQKNVVIYEAALESQGLFIRVDILRKRGAIIELIEVKAKSYNPEEDGDLRGKQGGIASKFKSYLYDVAFQAYVATLALPDMKIQPFLMMADKTAHATVDQLNQRFKVVQVNDRAQIQVAPGTDADTIGAPILRALPVAEQVEQLWSEALPIGGKDYAFDKGVRLLAQAYRKDRRIEPIPGMQCGGCEFQTSGLPVPGEGLSGFHECWKHTFGWRDKDFTDETMLDLWNFRGKDKLIAAGKLKLSQVTEEDLKFDGNKPDADGLTRPHRQWLQCRPDALIHLKAQHGDQGFYFDHIGFKQDMRAWRWPLHLIDFETCAAAIPFTSGRHPYETIAFQFSHHVLHKNGWVEHRTQFLDVGPGKDPCWDFLRALQKALSDDDGMVFRWATHENTVLNQLRQRLLDDAHPPKDKSSLIRFIGTITERAGEGRHAPKVAGERNMVDLCKIAERRFFCPATKASSSLKKVLPALMNTSDFLRSFYSTPRYGADPKLTSLNFKQGVAWWQQQDGIVLDPYHLLPLVFTDIDRKAQDALEEDEDEHLKDGGAALAAYVRMQSGDMDEVAQHATKNALLRYCELDTLAMVMAVQAWLDWSR